MSPSMPITIASPASATSSAASSPSSSSTSTSSSGVYIPVHRRTPSDLARRAAPESKRTLPIYTPAELMHLAQSPLAKEVSAAVHSALQGQEFAATIALSRRQQRSREYKRKTSAAEDINNSSVVAVQAVTPRRRPVGRAAERNNSRRGGASKFMGAASWRPTTRQPVALAV